MSKSNANIVIAVIVSFVIGCSPAIADNKQTAKPNILIVTVDDMSCDSVGAFGCKLEGTTPNIDQLAANSLRYQHAHVQVGNCYPSRNVLFSGRYPHNTGVEGFYPIKEPKYLHMVDLVKAEGYYVAIRGKVSHSTPYQPYGWDDDLTILDGKKQDMKNADSYFQSTKRGIENAKAADKPFCINVNISDPHKPFYAMGRKGDIVPDKNVPSRIYKPEEVPIPGFLFDNPDVRLELAHYYSSVRRADDCFGAIMKALKESGNEENTIVIFLSDHGMPLPFAKTGMWNHSTRTPWIVHWPGVTKAGSVDDTHMISAVDLMPTLMEIIGASTDATKEAVRTMDGKSFLSTIRGQDQEGRDLVYKVYNENSGGNRSPMRCVQSKKFGYHFNPWSNGERVFKTATQGTMSYRKMKELAPNDEKIAARLNHFEHNSPEEFYDYEYDPDGLNNLVNDPKYAEEVAKHRAAMREFMKDSNDPILEAFDNRDDPNMVSAYVDKAQKESDVRRANRRKGKRSKPGNSKPGNSKAVGNSGKARPAKPLKQNKNLFAFELPESVSKGSQMKVILKHVLRDELGEQKFHVTLKDANGKRIDRVVKSASGTGKLEVTFEVPAELGTEGVIVSAFVGEDYPTNLLHKTEGPIGAK